MTLEVSLVNLMDVLRTVTDVVDLGLHLGVPKPEMDKIDQNIFTQKMNERGKCYNGGLMIHSIPPGRR